MVPVETHEFLAARFAEHRTHLKAVAYRMLGSLSEADDAVQEAWLRLARSDTSGVANLAGWLTTVVGRVCLDMLRSRVARRESALTDHQYTDHLPDPVVSRVAGADPEQEALIADSVGLALLVVLESLRPAERLAFVLHDMFAVPFEEIGEILDRSPAAAKQLASRARQRVRGAAPVPDPDRNRQRRVADAFLAAAREGDFTALVAVLDPDVTLRADSGATVVRLRGAATVAGQALMYRGTGGVQFLPVLVNGVVGVVNVADGRAQSVTSFTVSGGRIVAIDILVDPERLRRLDLTVLD
jgi:RNA polymerase sigma factor (sigma-70 family)